VSSVRNLLATVALATAVTGTASAQDSLVIAIGARIRVTVADGSGLPLVGRYAGLRGDTLLVALPGFNLPVRYLLRTVRAVDVSQGTHRQAGPGAKLGAKIGAAMGVFGSVDLLLSTHSCRDASALGQADDQARVLCWMGVALAPFGMALWGAGYGALIGLLVVRENWLPVRLEGLHVGVVPMGRGTVGLGVGVSF